MLKARKGRGKEELLPYISYIGMCHPREYLPPGLTDNNRLSVCNSNVKFDDYKY